MEEQPRPHITAPGKPGAALVARLETLRDSHRLGLHMQENSTSFEFSPHSLGTLLEWKADDTQEPPLMSLSLLPSAADGFTLQPYECMPDEVGRAGYLMDLSDTQPHPPQIVACDTKSMLSGEDAYNKIYRSVHTGKTLDGLAKHYRRDRRMLVSVKGVAAYNEVIAHVGLPHVAALVVPYFEYADCPMPEYESLVRFTGALAGLAQAEHGPELPVATYHVNGAQKGAITYLGQGRAQLRAIAGAALERIMNDPTAAQQLSLPYARANIVANTRTLLGIDLDQPLHAQRDALAALQLPQRSSFGRD